MTQTHLRRPAPRVRVARPSGAWLAVAAALGTACTSGDAPPVASAATATPRVVASIFPLGDLAARVGGPDVSVEVLVPPRADPSTFEPAPRRMQQLSRARAFLLVGGGMDDWMTRVPGSMGPVTVVRMNEGLRLREGGHGEGTGDPHTWLDPILVRDHWVPRLVGALVDANPAAKEALEARGAALADSLTALDAWIVARLTPVRGRAFVATHSAWQYWAARYGVRELGAIYESPGREPSSRELAKLVDLARGEHAHAVFTEPQLGESGARALAQELGVAVAVLDPIGGPGLAGRDDYFRMMRFNAEQMASALEEP